MSFEGKLQEGEICIPECTECKKIVWPPSKFVVIVLGMFTSKKRSI